MSVHCEFVGRDGYPGLRVDTDTFEPWSESSDKAA